jgi:hypothetical protein
VERAYLVPADFTSRIDVLHHAMDNVYSSQDTLQFSLQSELSTCENLAKSLEPSGLLLASSNNPTDISEGAFIYRRQEILARCQDLQYAFHTLADIRDLIQRSYPQLTKAIQEQQQTTLSTTPSSYASNIHQLILSAPVISSPTFEFASDSNNLDRLDRLTQSLSELYERVSHLTQRADELIQRYYSIMSLINDKFSLVLEDLNQNNVETRQSSR